MGYRTLAQCVEDLRKHGRLVEVSDPVDPCLEAAEIQRRVHRSGGPAVLYSNVKGCRFPLVSNLFASAEQARFMFRDTWESVQRLIELKADPTRALRSPSRYWKAPWTAWGMLPRRRRASSCAHEMSLQDLPQVKSWPDDGGPFVTLPQVYTEDVEHPGWERSNLGMYRVQLAGNAYHAATEVGLHYQIHRGIGIHHAGAVRAGRPLPANVFVGGSPAMTLAAVMPLPEGLSELRFAGALAGHRIPMSGRGLPHYAEADFCIRGAIDLEAAKPEGPFGDHLGYYSLQHDFPVLRVRSVTHRSGAIWPFTVVGRPPQEDTTFGQVIHELTGAMIPRVLPGVHEVHAVDAAGVHPLLLAIGSERYTPYQPVTRPQELLTQANAILGQGQMSLAKYLWIASRSDAPALRTADISEFLQHLLRRIDFRRDVHFQTRTTIDTLDYSGAGLNQGSKVVLAGVGPPIRELPQTADVSWLPEGFREPQLAFPGALVVEGPGFAAGNSDIGAFCRQIQSAGSPGAGGRGVAPADSLRRFPLIAVVDDSRFTAASLENFLWVVFTRSDPAADIDGVGATIERKHWGCRGPLVIDARTKPHHAPPLLEDPQVAARIDALAARGGPLGKFL